MDSSTKSHLKVHAFICTSCQHKKPDGTYSDPEQTADLRNRIKKWAIEKFGKSQIRVNSSGCLGQCEHGISCAIYPQNKWLLGLSPQDDHKVQDVLEKLMKD